MAARKPRPIWLMFCALLAAPALLPGQAQLSPSLGQTPSSTITGSLPSFNTGVPAGSGASADLTGSSVGNLPMAGTLDTVNDDVNASSDQVAAGQQAVHPSGAFLAGASLFATSRSLFTTGNSARGSQNQNFASPQSASAAFSLHSGDAGSPKSSGGKPRQGAGRWTPSDQSSANFAGVNSVPAVSNSSGSKDRSRKTNDTVLSAGKPLKSDLPASGDMGEAASRIESLPDSTRGTAQLSPDETEHPIFAGLPEGLSYEHLDFNEKTFLQPTLHVTGVPVGHGQQRQNRQRNDSGSPASRLQQTNSSLRRPARTPLSPWPTTTHDRSARSSMNSAHPF